MGTSNELETFYELSQCAGADAATSLRVRMQSTDGGVKFPYLYK